MYIVKLMNYVDPRLQFLLIWNIWNERHLFDEIEDVAVGIAP